MRIEDALPSGYRIGRRRDGYSVYVDVSSGPIRREFIGAMMPECGGWLAGSAAVDSCRSFRSLVDAALWIVEQWETDHEQ